MEGGYELQIHRNTNYFDVFAGFFCKASGPYPIEIWAERYYNPATKTKNKWVNNL